MTGTADPPAVVTTPVLPPAFWLPPPPLPLTCASSRAYRCSPATLTPDPGSAVSLVFIGTVSRAGSDVSRGEPVAVRRVGRGHRARHPGRVGADRVGHVPGLQVGEAGPVADDVLQRGDVGVVDRRLIGVGQHPPATVYHTLD